MFVSFFPQPKLFFTSAAVWSLFLVLLWFFGGQQFGSVFGLGPADPTAPPIIGITVLWSKPFLWFYLYFSFAVGAFYAFWAWYSPHPWQNWSILVTAVILFFIYFSVQVSVAVNAWYGPFFDYVQGLMAGTTTSTDMDFYSGLSSFAWLALIGMNVQVVNAFIVSHWIFRWRTAMNNYFVESWGKLRHIEGASQRIQEDTMRFSQIMEDLGSSFVQSIMTLIAFLPVMIQLQTHITELPIVGAIGQPLVVAALAWCLFGTISVMVAGVKLPGLQFRNPAGRGRLPQGARLWRRSCGQGATRDDRCSVCQCPEKLFPALFSLYLFQRCTLHLPASRQYFLVAYPGAISRGAQDNIRSAKSDFECLWKGNGIAPVPPEFLVDHCRTAVCPQAPACLRGDARGRTAARHRQALSGAQGGGARSGISRRLRLSPASALCGGIARFPSLPISNAGDRQRRSMKSVIPDLASDRRERRVSGMHGSTVMLSQSLPRKRSGRRSRALVRSIFPMPAHSAPGPAVATWSHGFPTLSARSSLTRSGMTAALVAASMAAPVSNVGDLRTHCVMSVMASLQRRRLAAAFHDVRHSRPRERPKGAESVGNPERNAEDREAVRLACGSATSVDHLSSGSHSRRCATSGGTPAARKACSISAMRSSFNR